ncbi:M67 family metallopeptidase [Cohnella sp. GbtcB17]|uniref:M67 family metallopeptidase n=1 Tax=Cohnella sp. GbtcB17 TaxID=2824762 RepID=UPI001C2F55FC|nr:M67 family metallopeptidase [Cohnella sp. GbtcB17]
MRNPSEVQMTDTLLRALFEGCREALPLEACGVLLGARENAIIAVTDIRFIPNVAADPRTAFAFEPRAWIEAAYAAQKSRREVVGFFHSHPSGPPLPSASDIRGCDGSGCHLIAGFGPCEAVRAYKASAEGSWTELPLSVR